MVNGHHPGIYFLFADQTDARKNVYAYTKYMSLFNEPLHIQPILGFKNKVFIYGFETNVHRVWPSRQ